SDTTADPRAPQKISGTGRIAACWYAGNSFTANLNFTDGQWHRVSLYFLDWDRLGRVETVEVLDAASEGILNTQTISNFQEGKYFTWEVKGSVKFRLRNSSGPNALLMGIFVDAGSTTGGGTSILSAPSRLANGDFQLRVSGQPGQRFAIEASTDLAAWSVVGNVTLVGNSLDFIDPAARNLPFRFYRAVPQP
ncbi:MAG: hypothetical protein AB1813_26645, partial [Verrucomicrobiota bacterium]